MKTASKRIINGWAFYDWANSVYPLVITSSVFPIYFESITTNKSLPAGLQDKVTFLGMEFVNTALYAYTISASFLVIAALSPLLSGIADYSGNKKRFMMAFCLLGAVSVSAMALFKDVQDLNLGLMAVFFASIGYAGSLVFYNAYLPEIAAVEDQDRISAKGFSMGYLGSFLLLVACLALIEGGLWPKEQRGIPTRISFLLTGLWWIGFSYIPFSRLPDNVYKRKPKGNRLTKGFKELRQVWHQLKELPRLKRYLVAFFLFNTGVQTTMYMASSFGAKQLKMPTNELIITILLIQLVGAVGARLFAWISGQRGNIYTLRIAIVIWIGICISAYFVQAGWPFISLGCAVGLVMGAIQSMSRSTYSKLLPETRDHASFFSFFDVTEKLGYVIGIAGFGFMEELTGNMRFSALMLTGYFILALVALSRVPQHASIQAGSKA